MDLGGAGARVVVALLLRGPLTLEDLTVESGVSRRSLWAAVAQAEKAGLVAKQKAGRAVLYTFVHPLGESLRSSPSIYPVEESRLTSNASPSLRSGDAIWIDRYIDSARAKTSPQSAKTSPHGPHSGEETSLLRPAIDEEIASDSQSGEETALQGAKTSPLRSGAKTSPDEETSPIRDGYSEETSPERHSDAKTALQGEETAPDDEDLLMAKLIEADRLPSGEVSSDRNSPYVVKRKAQTAALSSLWSVLFPEKAVPERGLRTLLTEAGGRSYFVGDCLLDMAATGKDIEYPISYLTAAIKRRTQEGKIPVLPWVDDDPDEMTPELRANLDRVKSLNYWGSDDD